LTGLLTEETLQITLMAMTLREKLEPPFEVAEKRYPNVYTSLMEYTDFCDQNGDKEGVAYKKLENKLRELTGKDMSEFNLWEWWEEDGAENLAFAISMPAPQKIDAITFDELTELVSRAKGAADSGATSQGFRALFYDYLVFSIRYFHKLIELNFKAYDQKLFNRNKDERGNYFEYSVAEIVEKIWDKGTRA
jgi:hypothetical protein